MHDIWRRGAVFAPEGEGAGGGGDPAAGAGGGDPAAGGATTPKWFEDQRFAPHKDWINAKGMSVDDPLEALDKAIKVGFGAERHLGKPADSLITRPKEGESVTDWMRQNAAIFGLPETADKYTFEKPKLPDGVKWDETFEGEARRIAFETGMTPAQLNAMAKAYGARVAGLYDQAGAELQAANAEMMTALERDWGMKTAERIGMAQQAAQLIGAKAGLDSEAITSLAMTLKPKIGDAGVIKMFAAIGELIGEDELRGGQGSGAGGMGNTPAEARAKLAAMDAPDGEYGKAFRAGNRAEMARLAPVRDALMRIAASS